MQYGRRRGTCIGSTEDDDVLNFPFLTHGPLKYSSVGVVCDLLQRTVLALSL
jgi:hypothetical protein